MSGQDWDTVVFSKKTKSGGPLSLCCIPFDLKLLLKVLPISGLQSRLA